ncbi:hypothetical protein [Nonomuraea pusilla]|uniref:Uncharacterized protein n=1 Tax=Nonomuraea pusilla TaxID=46177 RepID=A0A1H8KBL5_9ACTN|nr:hypothetical protein [Nonomuraea pusilla]SEN90071.1 hypothetical protein SAMN05660976_08566 [Nonomuraea pusilla]
MPEFDPEGGQTYGAWLRSKNIQARPQGWSYATKDQVREYSGKDGRPVKDVTDQLGNRVVQHGLDQQSVVIRNPVVTGTVEVSP